MLNVIKLSVAFYSLLYRMSLNTEFHYAERLYAECC
jgi:hypothetical protein